MYINEIKRRFDLLKKVNNESYCLVSELAKELKVSKTDLMQFIENNPKLFSVATMEKRASKGVTRNLGLAVKAVYLNPCDNPITEEWLKKQIKEKANYIYISEIDYYGSIQGYYIEKDVKGNNREHLWRNTQEKLNKLVEQGIVGKYTFCVGGIGDCYNRFCEYALLGDWENKLIENGWKFNLVRK